MTTDSFSRGAGLLLLAFVFSVGCTINNNNVSDAGGPGPGGGDSGPGNDATGQDDDGGTPDGGGAKANSCSTGTLFAGNPTYSGDPLDRPSSGTGILADPPFQWQNLVFNDGWLFSRDTGELWGVDLSAGAPVEVRIAGKNRTDAKYAYGAGPCSTALFARIEGIAALPDKSLVVADALANGVLHVTNPTTSACSVEYWAGNTTASASFDPFAFPPNEGDVDGPGASAKLNTPGAIVTDDAGNAYFFDQGNRKIKKIAADSAHTVSTVVALPSADSPSRLTNMVRLGTKIYGVGTGSGKGYVVEVDLTARTVRNVLSGGGAAFPPMESSQSPLVAGITTDGTGLIVSGAGYVWYVTVDGTLTHIAGRGPTIDFPPSGYDPKASHPAMQLALPPRTNASAIGSADYVTYFNGALYVRAHGGGTASFIEKITCP